MIETSQIRYYRTWPDDTLYRRDRKGVRPYEAWIDDAWRPVILSEMDWDHLVDIPAAEATVPRPGGVLGIRRALQS